MFLIRSLFALLVTGLMLGHAGVSIANDAKPNVIVIYTDDQGYGDVSELNAKSKFQTPNMDRLAREGVAFTNGHSADSVCTPSRYGVLTGRYPWRTVRKQGVLGAEAPCMIADGRVTLATLFKDHGYHTALVGKWHLGMDFPGTPGDRDWSQPIQDMPLDKGFDYFYGIPASLNYGVLAWFEGRHAKVPPTVYTNKKKNPRYVDYRIMPPYEAKPGKSNDPTRTVKTNFEVAADFIDNQCLTRFTDKAIEWMGARVADAKTGTPFFLYLPYTSPHYPVCPLPEFHGQGDAGAYGEFLIETDYHVGRIFKFLETSGLDQDTLIVFTSDNGPEKSWTERLEKYSHDSRGGLRDGKRSVYEGGHRVPFLVRWPGGIEQPGRRSDRLVSQTDLLATFADLLGTKLPDNAGEDSHSFASALVHAQADDQRVPFVSHDSRDMRYAITDGTWKLVLPSRKKPAELYDLSTDVAESNNVATDHPELVDALQTKMNTLVTQGRSTPGSIQSNDTGHWEDLTWMTSQEYESLAK